MNSQVIICMLVYSFQYQFMLHLFAFNFQLEAQHKKMQQSLEALENKFDEKVQVQKKMQNTIGNLDEMFFKNEVRLFMLEQESKKKDEVIAQLKADLEEMKK